MAGHSAPSRWPPLTWMGGGENKFSFHFGSLGNSRLLHQRPHAVCVHVLLADLEARGWLCALTCARRRTRRRGNLLPVMLLLKLLPLARFYQHCRHHQSAKEH